MPSRPNGSTQMHRLRYATGEPRHEAAPTLPTSGGGGVGGLHRTQFEKQKEKFSKTLKTSVSFGLFWSLLVSPLATIRCARAAAQLPACGKECGFGTRKPKIT